MKYKRIVKSTVVILLSFIMIGALLPSMGIGGKAHADDSSTEKTVAKIITEPSDKILYERSSYTLTVVAEGVNLKYQWEYKSPTATTWSTSGAGGAKTATISLTAKLATNGYLYRCIITDANGTELISREAKLTVIPRVSPPMNKVVLVGSTVQFTSTMTLTGVKCQWQYKAPNSSSWVNSTAAGSKTTTITLTAKGSMNNYQYRCQFTDKNGNVYTSNPANLRVHAKLTTQPTDKSAPVGSKETFTVVAEGAGLKYQWYYRTPGSSHWTFSGAAGSKSATITLTAKTAQNNLLYFCIIMDANNNMLVTNEVTLTATAKITTQPVSKTAAEGTKETFTVVAEGAGLKYQWQYQADNSTTWVNSEAAGAKTATVTLTAKTATNGYRYRCVVTDDPGTVLYTDAVTMTAQ